MHRRSVLTGALAVGGLVAIHMARALPQRARALTLENPMGLEDYRNGLTRQVRPQDWADDERSMSADDTRQYMAHYFVRKDAGLIDPFVAVRTAVARGPEFERWVQSSAATSDMLVPEPAVDFVAGLPTRNCSAAACPTAPMWEPNTVVSAHRKAKGNIAEMAKGFADRMANARFVGVPDCGHVPHLETPAAFISAALEFLQGCCATRSDGATLGSGRGTGRISFVLGGDRSGHLPGPGRP